MASKRKEQRRSAYHRPCSRGLVIALGGLLVFALGAAEPTTDSQGVAGVNTPMVVFGYNDLGMHCMNEEFSELVILPPFNTLHAQVIERGAEPEIMESDVTVRYVIPANTHSADKTNFWSYPVLGSIPPDVGLAGFGMSGTMVPTGNNDWNAVGIPITPFDDSGRDNPYPLATITVWQSGQVMAQTQAVVPVSTEINCNLCHEATDGQSVSHGILVAHDSLHATDLVNQKPVLCASCHADNALGLPGEPGVPNLSAAMHSAHAPRMDLVNLQEECYACHPGTRTKCLRDVHFAEGVTCTQCHGDMGAVGNPARNPWVDEPRCGDCHSRPGFEFEQPGTLFRNSKGHGGVHCAACHGSPHAITPTVTEVDNLQAIKIQGHSGMIDTCSVCHTVPPDESFFHRVED